MKYEEDGEEEFEYSRTQSAVKALIIVIGVVVVGLLVFMGVRFVYNNPNKVTLGEQAVMLMYDFADPYELADNMVELREICSEPVFNKLTIDNENRTLQTYLKFKGEPVNVEIIAIGKDYVFYKLKTKFISGERKFMFMYKAEKGIITNVREMECIDFV